MKVEATVAPGAWPRVVYLLAAISIGAGLLGLAGLGLHFGADVFEAPVVVVPVVAFVIGWPFACAIPHGVRHARAVTLSVEPGLVEVAEGEGLQIRAEDVLGAAATPSHLLMLRQRGYHAPHVVELRSASDLAAVTTALGLPPLVDGARVRGSLLWPELGAIVEPEPGVGAWAWEPLLLFLPGLLHALQRAEVLGSGTTGWLSVDPAEVAYRCVAPTDDDLRALGPETRLAHADLDGGADLFAKLRRPFREPLVERAIRDLLVALSPLPVTEPPDAPLAANGSKKKKRRNRQRDTAGEVEIAPTPVPTRPTTTLWTDRGARESPRQWLSRVDAAIDARRGGAGVFRMGDLDTVALRERIDDAQAPLAERALAARALVRHEPEKAEGLHDFLHSGPEAGALRIVVHGDADEAEVGLARLCDAGAHGGAPR